MIYISLVITLINILLAIVILTDRKEKDSLKKALESEKEQRKILEEYKKKIEVIKQNEESSKSSTDILADLINANNNRVCNSKESSSN